MPDLGQSVCRVKEPDGSTCGEPVLVGQSCYDHALMGPGGQPMCRITGESPEGPPFADEVPEGEELPGRYGRAYF